MFLGSDLKPNQGDIALVNVDKLLNTAKSDSTNCYCQRLPEKRMTVDAQYSFRYRFTTGVSPVVQYV